MDTILNHHCMKAILPIGPMAMLPPIVGLGMLALNQSHEAAHLLEGLRGCDQQVDVV